MKGEHRISKPFVGVLSDVTLVGSHPFVLYEGEYVKESSVKPTIQTLNFINSLSNTPKRIIGKNNTKQEIDVACLLHHSWVDGYFHWIAETITRLEGVKEYEERTNSSPKLILGPNLNDFQRETLNLLGYSDNDLIQWTSAYGKVKKLVIPTLRREINPKIPSPFAYHWIREQLRNKCMEHVNTSKFSNRVYISRDDAEERRVVNESEVMKTLNGYGFEKYILSNMCVAEIIALFAQADVIVGPHGAGLTDIIYTEDVAVIEFHPEDRLNGVYFMITEQLNGWYGYLLCASKSKKTNDIVVNVDELEEVLIAAIDRKHD
ncbi:glycosyltransferase family 61 protein [Halovenus salina]|uniref:Glycosyltransferase family 61 protein n=1 Tax=Halovenus salina TaxID=1510225 RepID=A0ABD5W5H5_9EURY|nr:glycosyltransferase family 61 protein [Halovenus salina]